MPTLLPLLRQHPFLGRLNDSQLETLRSCAANVRFRPGEFVMREGDEASTFYLVREGRVALEIDAPGAGPTQIEQVEAGDILGLSWLFPPHRVHLDARALEPVRALSFDGVCLRGKMEADHDLGYALAMELLAHFYARLQRVRLQRLDVYGLKR